MATDQVAEVFEAALADFEETIAALQRLLGEMKDAEAQQ